MITRGLPLFASCNGASRLRDLSPLTLNWSARVGGDRGAAADGEGLETGGFEGEGKMEGFGGMIVFESLKRDIECL